MRSAPKEPQSSGVWWCSFDVIRYIKRIKIMNSQVCRQEQLLFSWARTKMRPEKFRPNDKIGKPSTVLEIEN